MHVQHNITIIQDIVSHFLSKEGKEVTEAELARLTKCVTLAAAAVLKDIPLYLTGEKTISAKECALIEAEFEKIRKELNQKLAEMDEYFEYKAFSMNQMLSKLRRRPVDFDDGKSVNALMEDFYYTMGCIASYRKWKSGALILGPHPSLPNYRVDKVIKNKRGLQIVVLIPDRLSSDKSISPILCCRGTTPHRRNHNLVDDLNDHIGQYSYNLSKKEIGDALIELTEDYGPVVITGHSLGGAIAQNITVDFCDQQTDAGSRLIKATYHFASPGVGDQVASLYDQKFDDLPEKRRPDVYDYQHVGDVVSLFGGKRIKATETKELGEFYSLSDLKSPNMSVRVAHSWHRLISELSPRMPRPTRLRTVIKSVGERIRLLLSILFKRILLMQIEREASQKETAKKIARAILEHRTLRSHHSVAAT